MGKEDIKMQFNSNEDGVRMSLGLSTAFCPDAWYSAAGCSIVKHSSTPSIGKPSDTR